MLCMLGGGSPITLFHVRGIRIAVDWSWFLVLFLVIFWLSRLLRRRARREQLGSTPFVLAVAQRPRLLRLDPPARARPRLRRDAQRDRHLQHPALDLRRRWRGWTANPTAPATEFKVAIAGPAGDPGDRRRPDRRSASPPLGWRRLPATRSLVETNSGVSGLLAMVAWLASINLLRPRLQPAAGLPDGRRPGRPGDRLVADRRPQLGDPLRRQPRPRLRLPLHRRRPAADRHRRRLQRHLAGADRHGDQRLRPRRLDADRDHRPDRAASASPT